MNAGDPLGCLVRVNNSGAGTATGVTVNDPLPAGVTWSIDNQSNAGLFSSSRRRHTVSLCGWSSDVCSSGLSVHVTAQTSAQACATYNNLATVTTTNDGTD